MTSPIATLTDLLTDLSKMDSGLPIVFHTPEGDLGGGTHVTELKKATIESIDCGGTRRAWTEAQLQIMDGAFGGPLTVEKTAAILRKSDAALPGLADARLTIEGAVANTGLTRLVVDRVEAQGDRAILRLLPDRAECKAMTQPKTASACCG